MNIVIISGRLTKDPEIRQISVDTSCASFCVAVYDGKDREGNKKTVFVNCEAWRDVGEKIKKNFTKGQPILVTGKWSQDSFEGKDGQKRRSDYMTVFKFEYMSPRGENPENAFAEIPDGNIDLPF